MKKILGLNDLDFSDKNFWRTFFVCQFPNAYDKEADMLLGDLIAEIESKSGTKLLDMDYIDELTGYYDGVLEEADGYIDNPTAFVGTLKSGDTYKIEFHPDDTVYYVNDKEIGCTGPHFRLAVIPYDEIKEYAVTDKRMFILLLPMAKIGEKDIDGAVGILSDILKEFIGSSYCDIFAKCVIRGLREI